MSDENKVDNTSVKNNENVEPPTNTDAASSVKSLPLDAISKSTESLTSNPTASKLKAPLALSNLSGPPSRIGRLCSQHNPKPSTSPPPASRESIMNRESSSPSSTTYTDLYQETVRQFTRSSLSPEIDRNSPSRMSMKSRTSRMSNNSHDHRRDSYDLYLEATGRRRSSDHGAVLTADTEQFIIGQRVWVGGIRPGQIAYIGETHFAPGEWAGVVLDEPNGKNDGCVAGKRYFQCEPKRGIFSRLTRLTMIPLSGANTPTTTYGKFSPERSMTISPTASLRSYALRSPTKNGLTVGDRVIVSSGFGSRPGVLRYLGETQFASGNWCGVELDEASGKNDGSVDGIRYFECKAKYGVFVPIAKVSLSPSTKKTRLSRTGSRESLTSIGTMNSIATTNTSRMRMNAQRKLSTTSTKLSSVPKAQFSMQDLLRDKQNHIEKLMIERDLDREDAQNQALNFQKNINELKLRNSQLEMLLSDERKKTEDLQFSIDEATFCGDEYSAQSQYFNEKIHKLEQKLKKKDEKVSMQAPPSIENTNTEQVIAALNAQILQITAELAEKTTKISKYENDIAMLEDDVKQRQSSLEFLQNENETLLKELRDKDENLEKFTLSESGLNNVQKEILLIKQEYENERKSLEAEYSEKQHAEQLNIKQLTEDMAQARLSYAELEATCTSLRNECDAMKMHNEKQSAQLQDQTNELQKISAELIILRAENSTLDELLKTQKQDSSGSKTALDSKIAENQKMKQEIGKLIESKNNMDINMKSMEQQVEQLKEANNVLEAQLQAACSSDSEKTLAMQQQLEQMQKTVIEKTNKMELLSKEIENIKQAHVAAENAQKLAENNLKQQQEEISKLKQALQQKTVSVDNLEKEIEQQKAMLATKQTEIEAMATKVAQQNETAVMLQSESSTVVQELTAKLNEMHDQVNTLQQKLKTNADDMLLQEQVQKKQAKELADKNAELQTLSTANATNEQLLLKIRQEYDDSQQALQKVNQQLYDLQIKFQQQQVELQEANIQISASANKCENLVAQNVALQKQHDSLHEQSKNVQNELRAVQEQLQNKNKMQEEQQHESNSERLRFEANLEEYQQQIKNLQNQLEILDINLKKVQVECNEKQKLISELEENAVKKELALSDVKRQLENVQSKYDALQAEKLSLQQDLLNLRSSSSDTSVEIVKMTQDLTASQKAYETLLDKSNAERAALEREVEANRQKIDALCKQLETLTQELKTMTTESMQYKTDLQGEQGKCEKLTLDLNKLQRRLEVQLENIQSLEAERAQLQIKLNQFNEQIQERDEKLKTTQEQFSANEKLWREAQSTLKNETTALQSQLAASEQLLEQLKYQLDTEKSDKETKQLEFAKVKSELEAASKLEMEHVKAVEVEERKKIIDSMEAQIKTLEQNKLKLDEAVVNMQNQIKLLQDELLKSQLDFKSKEEDMGKQLHKMAAENKQLQLHVNGLQNTGEQAQVNMAQEKAVLARNLQELKEIIEQRDTQLQELHKTVEQLAAEKLQLHTNAATLEKDMKKLQNELEVHKSEMDHRLKLSEADKQKINELKQLLDTLQASHGNIAATNAELSAAMALLEREKFETTHIFELFEMESDQNAEQLLEKLSNMKQQLAEAQVQLLNKETEVTVAQKSLASISQELQNSQTMLKEAQTQLTDIRAQLEGALKAQQDLLASLKSKDENLQANDEILQQLEEYKKIVEEMSDAADQKTAGVEEQEKGYKIMAQQRHNQIQHEKELKIDYIDLQRHYESMEAEKLREIKILQDRIMEFQAKAPSKHNGGGDSNGDAVLFSDDSTAQINFLNSIIADMQKKNDTLKAKIEALEMLPTDYTKPKAFDFVTKRKPAPRVFCDICDEFDKHETEDCPLQASEDFDSLPLLKNTTDKERTLPEPRKYCESCEVFGHDTGECGDECF